MQSPPTTAYVTTERVGTGRDGPIVILPRPYRSEIGAREAAKSQADERGNNSGSGYFESRGLPPSPGRGACDGHGLRRLH